MKILNPLLLMTLALPVVQPLALANPPIRPQVRPHFRPLATAPQPVPAPIAPFAPFAQTYVPNGYEGPLDQRNGLPEAATVPPVPTAAQTNIIERYVPGALLLPSFNPTGMPWFGNVTDWCDHTATDLQNAINAAGAAVQTQNDRRAQQILVQALIRVRDSYNFRPGSILTRTVAQRALYVYEAIARDLTPGQPAAIGTLSLVLFKYTEYVLSVAQSDLGFFQSMVGCGAGCGQTFNLEQYYSDYLHGFAVNGLNVVTTSFVSNWGMAPVGNPIALLRSGQMATAWLYTDILRTPNAYQYACVLGELSRLSTDIQTVLSGSCSIRFSYLCGMSPPELVAVVTQRLLALQSQFGQGCGY